MDNTKTEDLYIKLVQENAKRAQETGDIPECFEYGYAGKKWVLTLPHSVMAQKRIVYARNKYLTTNTFEAEQELLELIAKNATMAGQPVNLNQLEMGEVEVLKLAYMDGLLLPLSLGGDKAVLTYMEAATSGLRK